MSHMVIFRTAEGKPGYHQSENLDEAVRFVEHLRNSENVPDARIFRMQEVPIEFKTYVRVEVAGMDEAPAAAPVASAAPVAPAAPVAAAPAAVAPVGAAAAPVVPTVVDKSDDVVVDPMPAGAPGPGGGAGAGGPGGANNRFGRFNRG
jgi:hypothetical protein